MPSWSELVDELNAKADQDAKSAWLDTSLNELLVRIGKRRGTNVVVYSSAFLQKPMVPPLLTSISREDINGFMCSFHGLDFDKGLTLIVHTPGGEIAAVETIVDYMRSKFAYVESIVPAYAMSGGAMIALGCDLILMGRQSQLGPIDAQLPLATGLVSASSIIGQFKVAKEEISADPTTAVLWAPILQAMGPSLLEQAQKALALGQQIAEQWLTWYMFAERGEARPNKKGAAKVAEYFNSEDVHLNHGRRIGVDECEHVGLKIERLEADQEFQDDVLSVYHLLTIAFEQSQAVKIMRNQNGRIWVKNFVAST